MLDATLLSDLVSPTFGLLAIIFAAAVALTYCRLLLAR